MIKSWINVCLCMHVEISKFQIICSVYNKNFIFLIFHFCGVLGFWGPCKRVASTRGFRKNGYKYMHEIKSDMDADLFISLGSRLKWPRCKFRALAPAPARRKTNSWKNGVDTRLCQQRAGQLPAGSSRRCPEQCGSRQRLCQSNAGPVTRSGRIGISRHQQQNF